MLKKIMFAITGFVLFAGCYYDKEDLLYPGGTPCGGVDAKFSTKVFPLMQNRCAIGGCHDAASTNHGGPFTNYDQIKAHVIEIRSAVLSGLMPQGSSLTADEIKLITCWIEGGAPNN
jgi:uncharacterized membrane protein